MDWIIVIDAGLFRVSRVIGLKYSEGLVRVWTNIATVIKIVTSVK